MLSFPMIFDVMSRTDSFNTPSFIIEYSTLHKLLFQLLEIVSQYDASPLGNVDVKRQQAKQRFQRHGGKECTSGIEERKPLKSCWIFCSYCLLCLQPPTSDAYEIFGRTTVKYIYCLTSHIQLNALFMIFIILYCNVIKELIYYLHKNVI